MSHNEQLPLPPQEPLPPKGHMEQYAPLGQRALMMHEKANQSQALARWHEQAADFADQMGYRVVPDEGYASSPRIIAREIPADGPTAAPSALAEIAPTPEETGNVYYPPLSEGHRRSAETRRKTHDTMQEYTEESLTQVRSQLKNFGPNEQQMFAEYFDREATGDVRAAFDAWKQEFGNPNPAQWLTVASNQEVLGFLHWHNRRIEGMNRDPKNQERIQQEKADYKVRLQQAIDKGMLPEEAALAFERVDNTEVIIGDIFDTLMKGRSGYHNFSSGRFVVGEAFTSHTFRHEMNHGALGWLRNQYLNEAMTEHLSLVLEGMDVGSLEPGTFPEDSHIYAGRRQLMAAVLRSGKQDLLDTAIATYLKGEHSGPAADQFDEALNASFEGIEMTEFINQEVALGFQRANEAWPNQSTIVKENIAMRSAATSVKFLGDIQQGKDRDASFEPWTKDILEGPGSDELKKEFIVTTLEREGLTDQYEHVRKYLAWLKNPDWSAPAWAA